MRLAKPDIVQIVLELESLGHLREGGSPFTPPKIKGRRIARPKEIAKKVFDALVDPLEPREVDASPLTSDDQYPSVEALGEINISPFLDYISGEDFDSTSIGKVTKAKGWDAAGWYCPIHFYGYDWGIYMRITSVYAMALDILHTYAPHIALRVVDQARERVWRIDKNEELSEQQKEEYRKADAAASALYGKRYRNWLDHNDELLITEGIRAAYYILYHHELFHHFVETLGIKCESSTRRPVYVSYTDSVFKPCKGTELHLEEALANAYSYRAVKLSSFQHVISSSPAAWMWTDACIKYLEGRFPDDPPGYNRALEFVQDADFLNGLNLLIEQMMQCNATPFSKPSPSSVLAGELTYLFGGSFVRTVEVPERSDQRILRDESRLWDNRGKKLQGFLKSCGYQLIRQGKHEVWFKDGRPIVPVPRTKHIKDGTAESILKLINPSYRLRDFESLSPVAA